jgi:hypothetical protein
MGGREGIKEAKKRGGGWERGIREGREGGSGRTGGRRKDHKLE